LISREDTGRALPADGEDLARLLHLRQTYEDRGPGLLAWPAARMPVVCTASILFTDLRGFTGLTERFAHDPAGLLDILNAHLKKVLRSIAICGGEVEKFVGDGVMATFGASGHQPDHEDRAMAAAIGLVGANEALNRRSAGDWGFRLEVGVGIASGPVVVGAVKTQFRTSSYMTNLWGVTDIVAFGNRLVALNPEADDPVAHVTELLVHGWDLARATGQDETLDPEKCAAMLEGMLAWGSDYH